MPQLLNVVRAKSAEGLSPLSLELEAVSLAIATTYGFITQLPITAFGEVVVRGAGRRGYLVVVGGVWLCRLLSPAAPGSVVSSLGFPTQERLLRTGCAPAR